MKSASAPGVLTCSMAAASSGGTRGASSSISAARAFTCSMRASMSVVTALRVGQHLDACDAERQLRVVVEPGDAEALVAVHDELVRAVGTRDVAQDRRHRADGVEIALARVVDLGMALEQQADATLGAHGFLHGRDRRRTVRRRAARPGRERARRCAPAR